jgi:hypothetical protein
MTQGKGKIFDLSQSYNLMTITLIGLNALLLLSVEAGDYLK